MAVTGFPTDFDEILILDETLELYTQRPISSGPPVNKRFSLKTLRDWLKTALSKLYFRADGPVINEYEFTLGGAFNWKGDRGMRTRLDGNRIFIGPQWEDPVDGQVWTYDESLDEMVLKDIDADKHVRILVTSASVWNLNHNLGFVPNYIAKDESDNILHGLRETIDVNNEKITFGVARAGYVDFT